MMSFDDRHWASPEKIKSKMSWASKQTKLTVSLVVLESWPWPRGSSRTPHEGLGLGAALDGLERKVLALILASRILEDTS